MRHLDKILILMVTIFITSCGSKVDTVRPVNTDLSQYQTFAFLPNANVDVEGRRYGDEVVNEAIVEAINANMRQAGYTLDRDNPDLLVLVSLSTDVELQRTQEPVYSYFPYRGGAMMNVAPWYDPYFYHGWQNFGNVIGFSTDTYPYEEGTLVIDIVERESRETVWRGIVSEGIYGESTTEAVTGMINEVFDEYPVNNQ